MELAEVLDGIAGVRVSGPADPSVLSIAYDSRKVSAGAIFFALPGEKVDGNQFVGDCDRARREGDRKFERASGRYGCGDHVD